jgi:DNA-binding NarL/FixJ family response regulator
VEQSELREIVGATRQAIERIRAEVRGVPAREIVSLAAEARARGAVMLDVSRTDAGDVVAVLVMRGDDRSTPPPTGLTPRQTQVARLVAEGCTNQQIAARLGISLGTAKDHVHAILRRTGHRNRAALIAATLGVKT